MKRKRVLIVLLIFTAILSFSACAERGKKHIPNRTEAEILALADNDTPYDELITREYARAELVELHRERRLVNVDNEINIECLRKADENWSEDWYYSIFKAEEGGMFVTVYESYPTFENGAFIQQAYWYFEKVPYSSDFDKLTPGVSNVNDVIEISPNGIYTMFGYPPRPLPPFSRHNTIDGYSVMVYYNKDETAGETKEEQYIVADVVCSPANSGDLVWWYSLLQPVDREALAKMTEARRK